MTPLTTLIVPDGYDRKKGKPVTVIVWLHGMGSTPTGFVDPAAEDSLARALANELNVAFVGVSGTKVKGADRFVWAENAEADLARVTAALEEVKDRVTVTAGRVIAFGFSQGAQTGFELAARRPDLFAGAIVLSPGSDRENLGQIKEPSALLKQRGFVFGCGAREHPGNKLQARNGAEWAKAAGAKVDNQLFPNQSAHSFPEDINARFPQWVTFVLAANEKK